VVAINLTGAFLCARAAARHMRRAAAHRQHGVDDGAVGRRPVPQRVVPRQ
jgi:NAD(P)-dependent dehydrogenase (short-subunit alcohol dehydrogenase family)